MTDWPALANRAAFESHRLIGWIYWDPAAVEAYTKLGIPNGAGYYVTSRAGRLGHAGHEVVTAAYYSIHPDFVRVSYELLLEHATPEDAMWIRDDAVVAGLRHYAPEIGDDLAAMAAALWDAADSLPIAGHPLFAAQLRHRRGDDALLSAWLAVNCIREWRGDTHWALHLADDLTGTEAGILDGAWRNYGDDWLPKSRGADAAALAEAYARLEARGLATDGVVNERGIAHRKALEDRLDQLAAGAWRHLGSPRTERFVELVASVGDRLMARIDATAGEKWMPAGRRREVR